MSTSDLNVPPVMDLRAPGAIDALLAYHRTVFGDARMEEGAPVDGAPGAPADGAPAVPAVPVAPAAPVAGAAPEFTTEQQAFIDSLVGKVKGETATRLQREHQAALDQAQALAGKSEAEAAAYKVDQANAAVAAMSERVVAAEAKVALIGQVAPENHAAVLRLADLPKADATGAVDEAAVAAAITAVLEAFPVFKVTAAPVVPVVPPAGVPAVPSPTAPPAPSAPAQPSTLAEALADFYKGSN